MDYALPIIHIVLGLSIAFLGRKLIWLFIAAAGFLLAYEITYRLLGDNTLSLFISVGVGLVAGYYATKFAAILINIAGFILIGNAALIIYGWFFPTEQLSFAIIVFAIGGLIGLGMIRTMFDLAIIIISALGGASMVIDGVDQLSNVTTRSAGILQNPTVITLVTLVIVVIGFYYQYRAWKAEPAGSDNTN